MFPASRGRYLDFCPGVAQRNSALLQMVFCTSTITPAEGSTAESSSTARTDWKNVPPWPPYSSGISIPIRPISKNCLTMSLRKTPASSISRTYGRICSRANRRTVVWKSRSSSDSAVNGGGGVSRASRAGMSEAYSFSEASRQGRAEEESRAKNAKGAKKAKLSMTFCFFQWRGVAPGACGRRVSRKERKGRKENEAQYDLLLLPVARLGARGVRKKTLGRRTPRAQKKRSSV